MAATGINLAVLQLSSQPGNIQANLEHISRSIELHSEADLLVFPELFITGSQLRSLFLDPQLPGLLQQASIRLCQLSQKCALLVGMPLFRQGKLYNGCALFADGKQLWSRAKPATAMHSCLHESLYFQAADDSQLLEFKNIRILVTLGAESAQPQDCDLLLCLRCDSFNLRSYQQPEQQLASQAQQLGCPAAMINSAGAHEQWVFAGMSCLIDSTGHILHRAKAFSDESFSFNSIQLPAVTMPLQDSAEALVYAALVASIKSYAKASYSKGALLGLSGGIDSALVLALAVDALGADKVTAVMMPYHYTAQISQDDAAEQARMLGVNYHQVPIAPLVQPFAEQLQPLLEQWPASVQDTTEQNLQARSRGMLLMALSNRSGALLLTTSNKSEMAVGYCTLYGDMAGGFAPLKDIPKTLVYRLCNYRNSISPAIPQRVIDRPPSAELAPDQLDTDNLPPYEILDEIIERRVEQRQSAQQIVASGIEAATVERILRLLDINEYKRRQAATGPQITSRSLGLDYDMPMNARLSSAAQ